MKEELKITRRELKELIFWASYGIAKGKGGSFLTVYETMKKLNKEHKLQIRVLKLGQYVK